MPLPTQKHRQIAVSGPLGDDVLLFYSMKGTEKLGRLFEYQLELLSTKKNINIKDVLGKNMSIRLDLVNQKKRYFNGVVTRFCLTDNGSGSGRYATYTATLRPWTWLLTRSSNCRIFQEKSVLEIIKEVCHGPAYAAMVHLDDSKLSHRYEKLPYCVQYRETDFNFISRLMEQEGIYYFFKHDVAGNHTMVLADSYGAHEKIPSYEVLKYGVNRKHTISDDEGVYSWSAAGEIQPGRYVLNDFDFERAAASNSKGLLAKANLETGFEQPTYEMFDYPGGYTKTGQGQQYATARIESYHGQCEQINAHTAVRGLYPGGLFALTQHPRDDQNRDYLVTAADYELQSDEYESSGKPARRIFSCQFSAIGKEHNYRPEAVIRKPIVQGPQTGIVVGPAGEEIWTDKYGRIKVQFHWDRLGQADEKSSCWIRVSQSWAGKRWGAMFIPRIGQEVIVDFLEGDPDRPLVTGSVYNSDTMPPYELPANATRSGIKSDSSKGSGGFNELRFEDKKDKEEVFVQAERDYNRVVKNNDTLKVGFEKKSPGDQTVDIKNDQKYDIGHDQVMKVTNDQKYDIGHDQTITVKNNQKFVVSNDQKINIGNTSVITALTSIELKVGGSSIKIEPEKITIKSAMIEVNGNTNVEVKSGETMKINSGAVMTIEGALVKIN